MSEYSVSSVTPAAAKREIRAAVLAARRAMPPAAATEADAALAGRLAELVTPGRCADRLRVRADGRRTRRAGPAGPAGRGAAGRGGAAAAGAATRPRPRLGRVRRARVAGAGRRSGCASRPARGSAVTGDHHGRSGAGPGGGRGPARHPAGPRRRLATTGRWPGCRPATAGDRAAVRRRAARRAPRRAARPAGGRACSPRRAACVRFPADARQCDRPHATLDDAGPVRHHWHSVYVECQRHDRSGGERAHLPVRLHRVRPPARGGAVLLGRAADRVPACEGRCASSSPRSASCSRAPASTAPTRAARLRHRPRGDRQLLDPRVERLDQRRQLARRAAARRRRAPRRRPRAAALPEQRPQCPFPRYSTAVRQLRSRCSRRSVPVRRALVAQPVVVAATTARPSPGPCPHGSARAAPGASSSNSTTRSSSRPPSRPLLIPAA